MLDIPVSLAGKTDLASLLSTSSSFNHQSSVRGAYNKLVLFQEAPSCPVLSALTISSRMRYALLFVTFLVY